MAWSASDNCAATPTGGSRGTVQGPQPFWLKYTYDDKGNRTKQQDLSPAGVSGSLDHVTDYTYSSLGGAHAHTLTKTSGYTTGAPTVKTDANYSYNATGSMTDRTGATAGKKLTTTYYDDGRTNTLTTPDGGTTTYIYDADGKILIRRDPVNVDVSPTAASQVRTAYIGGDQYRVVAGTTGITTTRQYTHAGMTIGQRVGNASISWMFADANNTTNISVATTPGGSIGTITRRFFDPFGVTLSPTTNGPWPNKNTYLNTPTNTYNLVDMGARLYDPTLGRFTTVDPILTPYNPRQNNGYNYAWNNPLMNPDSSGLAPEDGDPNHKYTKRPIAPRPAADITILQWYDGSNNTFSDPLYSMSPALYEKYWASQPEPEGLSFVEGMLGVGIGFLAFAACTGSTAGFGAPACGVAAGALASGVMSYSAGNDWRQILKDTLWGGVTGGVGGFVEKAIVGTIGAATVKAFQMCSFGGKTTVLMADGTLKPIETITVGDIVIATDAATGVSVARRVSDVWVHEDYISILELSNGEQLETTKDHRFWNATDGEFQPAGELEVGDRLISHYGQPVFVVAVSKPRTQAALAYNMTVEVTHTYHVGSAGTLVHNDCIADRAWDIAMKLEATEGRLASLGFANIDEASDYTEAIMRGSKGNQRNDGAQVWRDGDNIIIRGGSRTDPGTVFLMEKPETYWASRVRRFVQE